MIQPQQKTIWQYQWWGMEPTELTDPHFLLIPCKYHNRHVARGGDQFIVTAAKQLLQRDWHNSAISKLKFSITN